MRLLVTLVFLAVLGGGGFLAYKKFIKKEEVKLEVPKVEVNVKPGSFAQAESFYNLLQYDKAIPLFQQVISENKDPAEVEKAHFRIASAYNKSKQYAKAITAYEAVIAKYPRSPDVEQAKKALEKLKLEQR